MQFQDTLRMSLDSTFRQKRRIVPVLTGISLSTTLILIIIITGATISNIVTQQILGQGNLRQITVMSPNNTGLGPSSNIINDSRIASWQTLPHVAGAYPNLELDVTATTNTMGIMLFLSNQPDQNVRPELLQGTWPQDQQIIVPDTGILNKLDQNVSGSTLLGETITLRIPTSEGSQQYAVIPVTVSGVYKATQNILGQILTFTTLSFMKNLVKESLGSAPLMYQVATIMADQPQNVSEIASIIQKQGFSTNDIEDQLSGETRWLRGIIIIGIALALFIFILVSLSIGNLLASSVLQRRKEIGIMLAIGFTNRSIGQIVQGEAIVIGIVGAIGGILIALISLFAFTLMQPQISLDIPWWGFPCVIAISALLCALAGILPARKAMRLDVMQTLREE